ncbi:MAG TPA: hypothetical protein VGW38_17015, partial [Chloroflexota bacterium]|nr:hypothetical protein [Chloroflexota bacterium]
GMVVALTAGSDGAGRLGLEFVTLSAAARPHAQQPGLYSIETLGVAQLATDGRRYAIVAYQRRAATGQHVETESPTGRCVLLVVDLISRESVSAALQCGREESIRSLALDSAGDLHGAGTHAVYAYVGLENTHEGSENRVGRLLAMELPSGKVIAAIGLSGKPVALRLALRSRGEPAALYVLESSGGDGTSVPLPEQGRVLVLDPLTLGVLGEYPLNSTASHLATTSDGQSVFLVHRDTVQRLDLPTGKARQMARLPGHVVAAEVLRERLYLASPEARVLWVLDARTGYRQPDLRVAGHPISLAVVMYGAS